MIEERRKYIRLPAEIKFTYRVKGVEHTVERAVTKNLSPGGISALVNKQVKKGAMLELNINVPNLNKSIFAIAKVVWTADQKADKIDVGIKFEEIDADMKNKFLEYICEIMFVQLERLKVKNDNTRRF
ncbi:MAG: PilZ domain-containing protein [Candidatus Omnitrophica bacterium]|nr:PilZ domain-containing protein [Candidatus Omnitrophota bacterium]